VIDAEELNMVAGLEPRILPCRVVGLGKLSHDVMGVDLKLPQNQRLRYLAGQYIDILLSGGKRRSYSLANSPDNDEVLRLHIRQVDGGLFTTQVFTKMKEKDLLRMRGPMGTFFLRPENTEPIVLVAGGTGFAPMQAILEQQLGKKTSPPISLYWGVRSLRDLYRHEQCLQWAQDHSHFHYVPVLSEPDSGDDWQGQTGWVHDAVLRDHADLSGYQVYTAGPPVMIKAVKKAFYAAGLRSDRLYSDSFEFAGDHEI
jgi:CDP-4-dehydro-6-deoxyglucose reductase